MLLRLVFLLVSLSVAIAFVTQVLLPLWKGTKLFPWFRNNELASEVENLQDEIGNLKELNTLTGLKEKLVAERDSLSKKD
jgi:hypothetical protein